MNDFRQKFEHYRKLIKQEEICLIDIKIVNFVGLLKHFTYPARAFTERLFDEGIGVDGSSIGGYATVESSDLIAVPDIDTGFIDPFFPEKTLSFLSWVNYASRDDEFPLCPRSTAKRAVQALKDLKIADEAYWIPELEFFLLDGYSFSLNPMSTNVEFLSDEATTVDNYSYKLNPKWGYGSVPPYDKGIEFRTEFTRIAEDIGINIKVGHHECAVPGQHEFELDLTPLLEAGDHIILSKYIIKNLAASFNKVATFMPKPMYGVAGSGMHFHQMLTKKGKNIFNGKGFADLSDTALQYIGGVLKHARALTGITNPSTNSFKRLIPGYEAPTAICYSNSNRTAAVRIPGYIKDPQKRRFEYRPPDATGNPYFTLAALVAAGIDGIKNKRDPGKPAVGNIEKKAKYKKVPASLYEALHYLEKGHKFLLQDGIFKKEMIKHWVKVKRQEAFEVNIHPNPKEIELYFNF
ncbi:type I glutamate--ammonia ligase [bacterium]|nr:type I glutamate--ammonia ligase [bacterium]